MKKSLSLLCLIAMLCIAVLPASAAGVYTEGTLNYTVSDGSVTIVGCFGRDAVVTVPAFIAGKPVNTIGSGAFAGNTDVKTVNLPDTVVSIEEGAFGEWVSVNYNTNVTPATPVPTAEPTPEPTASAGTATSVPAATADAGTAETVYAVTPAQTAANAVITTASPTNGATADPAAGMRAADDTDREVQSVIPEEEEKADEVSDSTPADAVNSTIAAASDSSGVTDTATVVKTRHAGTGLVIGVAALVLAGAVCFVVFKPKKHR